MSKVYGTPRRNLGNEDDTPLYCLQYAVTAREENKGVLKGTNFDRISPTFLRSSLNNLNLSFHPYLVDVMQRIESLQFFADVFFQKYDTRLFLDIVSVFANFQVFHLSGSEDNEFVRCVAI